MNESDVRQHVVKVLRELDAISVENHIRPGTPDVNYVEGWIELKYVKRWPVKGGPLIMDHFTNEQRVWLLRRWRAGGMVHLLIRVADDWLLFDGDVAAQRGIGSVTNEEELKKLARFVWKRNLRAKTLIEYLRGGRNPHD